MMTQDILAFAQNQLAMGKLVALVTVTVTTGSSPASPGQIMAVLADGSSKGTVGGGTTEYRLIQQAADAIKNGESVFHFTFDHGENGMVCGGGMEGFGTILGSESHIFIFGAGHIGQCLAPLAKATGFVVTVIDDRPEFQDALSEIQYVACQPKDYESVIKISGSSYAVICTRGHKSDEDALRFCLARSPKYIGMIGSKKKVETLFNRLIQDGYDPKQLENIYSPIGLDIASSIPAEIAVSIMAEILLIKNNGSPQHKRSNSFKFKDDCN